MARTMINDEICGSDAFVSMSHSSQAVYYQLLFGADDDGFVSSPYRIANSIRCSEEHLNELKAKRFIIAFETGVVVIKHWFMHNLVRKDRYRPTNYKEELACLVKNDKGAYSLIKHMVATKRQPSGNQTASQVKLSKVNISKDNKEKNKYLKTIEQSEFAREVQNEVQNEVQHNAQENALQKDGVNLFEIFWKNYPRKIGKSKCERWFNAHKVKQALLDKMLFAIASQKQSDQWIRDKQYIPHPYTWLNQERWNDESDADEVLAGDNDQHEIDIDSALKELELASSERKNKND